ncbi:MAG: diaminopimelate epimerase [Candidatus Omnitrophota bacterium]
MAREVCDRKYGIGADGLLILEKSKGRDVRMRIFNADGSEAEMCGNGARCAALYFSRQAAGRHSPRQKIIIQTKAGIIESVVNKDSVRIKLTEPKDFRLDIPIKVNSRKLKINFINTGVPQAVIFVEGLDKIDVFNLGRLIRNDLQFSPAGTNVNFVEIVNDNSLKIRTYERGVEDETLACGTGSAASALITGYRLGVSGYRKINVHTKGGEVLKVYYMKEGDNFKDVWLEGKASIVYKGVYYV